MTVPDGLTTELFAPALGALLPTRTPANIAALAGPGIRLSCCPDVLIVPRHPRTDEQWQPSSTALTVPMPADMWAHLVFPDELVPTPSWGLPDGVLRDDPLPMHPRSLF